jgi:hypothetical protein
LIVGNTVNRVPVASNQKRVLRILISFLSMD